MTLRTYIINLYKQRTSQLQLNTTEKANHLFDVILKVITTKQWTYFPDGCEKSADLLLDSDHLQVQKVNCFNLSDLFVDLCKQIGIKNAFNYLYKHRPTSKIGQKINKAYRFQCFDQEYEIIDNQICFDQHCVTELNGRFYDLVFSCVYDHADTPYDSGPFAQVISYMNANNEKKALDIMRSCEEFDFKKTFRGETLLHIAAKNNFVDMVIFLVDKIDANKLSKFNPPEVALAGVPYNESEIFKILAEHTNPHTVDSIRKKNKQIQFDLAWEVLDRGGSVEEFADALQDTDINLKVEGGLTLLHYAALKNKLHIAEYILNNGADLNVKDDMNCKPIDYVEDTKSFMFIMLASKNESLASNELKDDSSNILDISMQVLGGFIAVLGSAIVATALILLNPATLVASFAAGLGTASIFFGLGLFAVDTYRRGHLEPIINNASLIK